MYLHTYCEFCVLNFTLHFFKRAKINYLKDQLEHTSHFLEENLACRDMKSVQIPIFPFCSQQNSNKNIVTIYSL